VVERWAYVDSAVVTGVMGLRSVVHNLCASPAGRPDSPSRLGGVDEDAVHRLAAAQEGLVTREQLRAAGTTRGELRWRLGRQWSLVLAHVVLTRRASLTSAQQLVAAVLEAGDDAVVTGHRACAWHGLRSSLGHRPVTVITGPTRASRRSGFVVVRRTVRPDPRCLTRGVLRVASPVRAVADATREAHDLGEARSVVLEAVRRRLVRLEDLGHEVEAGPRRGSRWARAAVQDARAGSWSVPEAELLHRCARSKVLPRAWPNPYLEAEDGTPLISPDLWFDDVGLAVMVHSRAHHLRDRDWEGTVESDGRLAEHGILVIGFTPSSVSRRPQEVVARIERAYLSAQRAGPSRPSVRMLARGPGLVG
jgi:hypothetical protein